MKTKRPNILISTKKKLKKLLTPLNIILFIILFLYAVIMITMLLWGLLTSLKSQSNFRTDKIGLPKGNIFNWKWGNIITTFKNFEVLINTATVANKSIGFFKMLLYTLIYALGGSIVITMVTCVVAYLTSTFDYALSKIVTVVVLIVMTLPIIGSYASEIQVLKKLGLYNTLYGAIIQKFNFLGLYFFVFQEIFKNIAKEYREAAKIDGASEMSILVSIMLPLARNTIFTIAMLRFIEFWNDYQSPLLYFPSYPTLAYGLQFITKYGKNEMSTTPIRLSGAIVIMLPILILFFSFKNRIMGNVSIGGIKE